MKQPFEWLWVWSDIVHSCVGVLVVNREVRGQVVTGVGMQF